MSNWRARAALLAAMTAILWNTGCPKRTPLTPPPGFAAGDPIVTGDAALDERIKRARQIAALTDEELQTLEKAVHARRGGDEAIGIMVSWLLGQGNASGALRVLGAWSYEAKYSEPAMATYLDLALGTDNVEDCIAATDEFLTVHEDHPYVLMVRGLCLDKMGRPQTAYDAFVQGFQRLGPMDGLSGVLERELGLAQSMVQLTPDAIERERLALADVLTEKSVVGHVLARHLLRLDVEQLPPDERLLDLGGVTRGEIDAVFASRRDAFRHCQKMYGKGKRLPGGRLTLHVTIRRDGSPGKLEEVDDTFEVEEVPACLEGQVQNLWFPPPRYGKAVLYEKRFKMNGDL